MFDLILIMRLEVSMEIYEKLRSKVYICDLL